MKGLSKAAKLANKENTPGFEKGFIQGAKHYKRNLWKDARCTPKQKVPLLLFLSNETMALGNFEGWGYAFSVPEDKLHEHVEVLAWLYITDLL